VRIRPVKSFEKIDELLGRTSDPDHRAMLENFKAHMTAEITCDIEGIMATMTPHPVYHSYSGRTPDEVVHVNGREQNRAMYQGIFDEGSSVLQLDIERLSVADWGIAGDGVIRIINPGKVLASRGIDVDDEDAFYLVSNRIAWFLPYDHGLMGGEDTYVDPATTEIVKLESSEVVTPAEAFA
jgi:hypothetical protein